MRAPHASRWETIVPCLIRIAALSITPARALKSLLEESLRRSQEHLDHAMNDSSLYVSMPRGTNFGWGVCGQYLTLELSRLSRVKYLCDEFQLADIGDRDRYEHLSDLWISTEALDKCNGDPDKYCLDHPIIQSIEGKSLRPLYLRAKSPRTIGYTFFETCFLTYDDVAWANAYYDIIVAGSTWCKNILTEHGIENAETIIQGVDASLFHAAIGDKDHFEDKFVVFSGGKMELRKGHDLVIRAFKALQDRHDDVLLINAWFNMWNASLQTMQISPYIKFDMPAGDYTRAVNQLMCVNGIDPRRVLTLPPMPQAQMVDVYKNTDCGLFPNRCEGGTNLVLMEYMACGKPAIASLSSGHKDVITEENCIPIHSMKDLAIRNSSGAILERWDDPDIEEVIEKLEWAYQNRDQIKTIGNKAAASMGDVTWERAAKRFMDLIIVG